jgi:hypothetical protein
MVGFSSPNQSAGHEYEPGSFTRDRAQFGGRMKHLNPHSKEWFVALAKLDPQQAASTRKIVKSAGAENVCSLCGDRPTCDYEVADKWFDPNTPVTFRLCEDCLSIRATNEGERLVPLSLSAE